MCDCQDTSEVIKAYNAWAVKSLGGNNGGPRAAGCGLRERRNGRIRDTGCGMQDNGGTAGLRLPASDFRSGYTAEPFGRLRTSSPQAAGNAG